ncbi:lamin tail domain-containing protein [Pseudocnuella soli]|uniref:lamin tail domain-containing protein n=1 Tax=Pseudocnuella soli TaxID=2502779 RepID=UPI001F030901|nr:lamin tail domain-containing protein [Pseudocnuella soli]
MMIVGKTSAFTGLQPSGDGSAYTGDLDFTGNGTAFDGGKVLYKGTEKGQIITNLITDQLLYIKIFTRRGTDWSTGLEASAKPRQLPGPGDVVINQFNPGYNSVNANYEYVELVNKTATTIDLSELAIRYQAPTTGNLGVAGGNLTGIMPPHSYWLLTAYPANNPSEEITVGVTKSLTRDGNISGGMGATAGQIALVRRTDDMVLDAVRYGNVSAGTYVEGTPLPAPSNGSGFKRVTEGKDLGNNSTDFVAVPTSAIDLRNSQSRLAKDGAVISAATNLKRIYVTGNAQIASNMVLTEKLVLQAGKLALNDFYLTTQNIEGGNANAYVQTNGTGPLAIPVTGATPILFPVGRSTYNPVTLQHPGSLSWSVNVLDAVQATNPDGAVQRTWNITPSAVPTTGATVSFQYDEGDATQLGSAFDVADQVQVYHQHEGVWKKAGDPLNPAGTPSGIRTVTLSDWTQFSAFALNGAAQGPLPVKFAGLRLFAQGTNLVLQFTVHNELGVDHYKVETSADGRNWEVRALLKPQSNSGATVQYEFRDGRPLVADRYYRVQAMEESGVVSFSGVARARAKIANPGLQVAPNPVVGTNMQYTCGGMPAGNYTVRIFNGAGQPVLVTRMVHAGGWLSANLVLPHLQGGWYVLELAGPQAVRQTFLVR